MPPRPGAFAELVAIPSENLLVVPRVELLQSAALTEPLACSWHAARLGLRLQDDPVEKLSCVVLGGCRRTHPQVSRSLAFFFICIFICT